MILDIALPFYGDVGYLKAAVYSVIKQENPNWRLLAVDDGYPDDTLPEWFKSLNDSRIVYSRNPVNQGANGNFRRCLQFVESDYCVVMGADDLMMPEYVGEMLGKIEQYPSAAIIHPGVIVIDQNGQNVKTWTDTIKNLIKPGKNAELILSGEALVKGLMRGNWMCFPSIVWKSRVIKEIGFRSGLRVTQDLALAIDVLKSGESMVLVDQKLFKYRRHLSSDSAIKAINGQRFAEEKELFDSLALELEALGWKKAAFSARLHITSRLHALYLLPRAVASKSNPVPLLLHAFKW